MNRAERRRQQKQAKRTAARADDPVALYRAADARHDAGDLRGAIAGYRKALAARPDFGEAHYNLALALKDSGNAAEALDHFREAARLLPDVPQTHNNLGTALADSGQPEDAVAAYRRALALAPNDPGVHFNLGVALRALERLDEAMASYRRALALYPAYAEAHYNLMQILEATNEADALRSALAVAKTHCAGDPRLAMAEAWLLRRDENPAAARAVLEAAAPPADAEPGFASERAYLLGELCDRANDAEAAYRWFTEGGRLARETPAGRRADPARYRARIETLAKYFTPDRVASWTDAQPADGRAAPVFMVGFPRSGTTLLDTILRSHHAVAVVEEEPMVPALRRALARLPGGDPDGLAALDTDGLGALRAAYFAELDRHLAPEDRDGAVIDKLPLNLVEAGLIHRVFPDAKFLLVLRHPCDCALSCFMQSFALNDAMANFMTLADSAALYDRVMALWTQIRELLPLDVHTVRYEDLVADFDGTVGGALDFFGLEWDDGVRDYARTARARGRIDTPSYNQVTQPIYTRASGRWERYREEMAPVLDRLLGWAARFGYQD